MLSSKFTVWYVTIFVGKFTVKNEVPNMDSYTLYIMSLHFSFLILFELIVTQFLLN
jgi:hypothetical protein